MDTQEQRIAEAIAAAILNKYYQPRMHWKLVNREKVLQAMQEYADLRCRPLIEEIEKLKEEIKGWRAYKENIDAALNSGYGIYRP